MNKVSLEIALEEQEFNAKLAEQQPEKQKEFLDEYMYSNPNDYKEMVELYTFYGYQYSPSLWAYQQMIFQEANEQTKRRLLND